ncbi:MAG: hypothetical protein K0B15_02350 [Lentimicrobium sp.]|nr:hypothetical protein [Lentimicrobium sp.]
MGKRKKIKDKRKKIKDKRKKIKDKRKKTKGKRNTINELFSRNGGKDKHPMRHAWRILLVYFLIMIKPP